MLIFLLNYIELFAKMLKETDIEEEIGFDFIVFIIDGILIGGGGRTLWVMPMIPIKSWSPLLNLTD